jgi:hypothetical protein
MPRHLHLISRKTAESKKLQLESIDDDWRNGKNLLLTTKISLGLQSQQ